MPDPEPHNFLAEYPVEITLQGPFFTSASEAGPWGVDNLCARDAQGRLYIPGTLIKGKLREALDEIGTDIFGQSRKGDFERTSKSIISESSIAERNSEFYLNRYPLIISDFIATTKDNQKIPNPGQQTITRTKIHPKTGSVQEGALRVIDSPLLPGEEVLFKGTIRFSDISKETAEKKIESIKTALSWITGFGAEQTTGMGRNLGVEIQAPTVAGFTSDSSQSTSGNETQLKTVVVDWVISDPFCVANGVVKGNIFESETIINGDILKGAIAQSLLQISNLSYGEDLSSSTTHSSFTELCKHFSEIRFTTARPCIKDEKSIPKVRPQSLAIAGEELKDFALEDDHEAPVIDGVAVKFSSDWKDEDYELVNKKFPIPKLSKELRVRTAIDSQNRRAKDQQLFAQRLICPGDVVWRSTIHFDSDEVDAKKVWQQLESFLNMGWIHIGKTKARTQSVFRNDIKIDQQLEFQNNKTKTLVLTLQSPAMLLDPAELVDESGNAISGTMLKEKYTAVWNEFSGKFKLIRFFATHRLIGGFQARRFRRFVDRDCKKSCENQKKQPYNPILLTEPGSVFVFDIEGQDVTAVVNSWLEKGLPLPTWVHAAYGETYHTNPFLPSNGYGEIAVNLNCHQELCPIIEK